MLRLVRPLQPVPQPLPSLYRLRVYIAQMPHRHLRFIPRPLLLGLAHRCLTPLQQQLRDWK